MTDDLKARLRDADRNSQQRVLGSRIFGEAADRIEALEAALRPFADCCEYIAADEDDEEWAKFRFLIKDYRRARAALAGGGDE